MLKFCGMDKHGFIAVIFIFVFLSNTCDASLVFHLRKLITSQPNNASTTSQVSPTGSPVNESNTNPINAGNSEEKQKESQTGNKDDRNNNTLPGHSEGPRKSYKDSENSGAPSTPVGGKSGSTVDAENEKKANATKAKLGNDSSCERPLTSCRDQEMHACIEVSKLGSKEVFLVVKNEGKSTLKVNINSPNYLKNDLPAFEVPEHQIKRKDISSIVGKSTELTVNSGNTKCVLHLAHPVSVDNLIQQLSFYSKQVSPMYIAYGSFLLALLFGGTWACCKLRKRSQENGIPYQELEMGLPESASGANVDATEGWDHNWDDDWDDDSAVKSPGGHQVRTVSADGLTSRSSKKDGWENDWED
ncbi:hypothetical protein CDL12_05919 [Handroanthus impetiginosus]|uniref:DUF7356 domain-containing protein n=1 Tax=Handroanthus impetiginosus TaxID=429701 RepID=A0A2G9HV37_9LAMI|nr:hypothetical protein CDL12_05919 [Handroanthus impetiginosus]